MRWQWDSIPRTLRCRSFSDVTIRTVSSSCVCDVSYISPTPGKFFIAPMIAHCIRRKGMVTVHIIVSHLSLSYYYWIVVLASMNLHCSSASSGLSLPLALNITMSTGLLLCGSPG